MAAPRNPRAGSRAAKGGIQGTGSPCEWAQAVVGKFRERCSRSRAEKCSRREKEAGARFAPLLSFHLILDNVVESTYNFARLAGGLGLAGTYLSSRSCLGLACIDCRRREATPSPRMPLFPSSCSLSKRKLTL